MNDTAASFSLRAIAIPAFGPTLMFGLVQGAVYPVLALSAVAAGASTAQAGLIVALLPIGQVLSNLSAAALTSRWGERRAMFWSALSGVAALLLCLAARGPLLFGLGALLLGPTAAVFQLARQTFLAEAAPLQMRARAMSTLGGMMRIGMFVGPFAAAAAVHQFGLAGAYWLALAAMLGAGGVALSIPDLPERAHARQHRPAILVLRHLVRTHAVTFLTLGTATGLIAALRSCRQVVIPLWATQIGLDAASAALIYGLMGAVDIAMFYPAGKLMDTHGRLSIALPCALLMGISFWLVLATHGFAGLLAASLLMGFGNGIGSGLIMTVGVDASPRRGRTEFLGIWRVITDGGGAAGPALLAGLTAAASLAAGVAATGCLGFAAAWMFWRWLSRRSD